MFDRLQKPFLTVETGEAYQPVRLAYTLHDPNQFVQTLENLKCIQRNSMPNSWNWFWQAECNDLPFESVSAFQRTPDRPIRLGTITQREGKVFLSLTSFKRACLAVPFFHKIWDQKVVCIHQADFVNKVFSLSERLPHGFTELFKEEELDRILHQRLEDYSKVEEQCELAPTVEEAFGILSDYAEAEAKKRLPYVERYLFEIREEDDSEVVFLSFYVYLRARELVAIKRWFSQVGFEASESTDATLTQVFGDMGVDLF